MTTVEPIGATWTGDGTHFRVFSSLAEQVELCLFDTAGGERRVAMTQEPGFLWHAFVPDARPGQAYGYRVHGPYDPARGLRCNPAKLLTDPYAKAITRHIAWDPAMFAYPLGGDEMARDDRDSGDYAARSYVVDESFDWGDDHRPAHAPERTLLYELHVKGFTKRHPGVPEALRGTFAGLATPAALESITALGVTAVELMPIHHFAHDGHLLDAGLRNYWGYNTYGFFAPHAEYAASGERGEQVREFKAMVKALHAAGLEVIIDVVYNHTAEGNHLGPTLSFKGFDNPAYYHLVPDNPRYYMDYTGTGNSLNLRHPYVLQLVMDSLRYWVSDMHVDGFRFDLAATLARGTHTVDTWSAFFATIHQDPVLQHAKLIAEPWDTGTNGYQVGNFPFHWSEWNDKYREAVRTFWGAEAAGLSPEIACRLTGSADLFQRDGRGPSASINYVTSHDGLTLRDFAEQSAIVARAGDEDARRGVRERLQRNLLATLLLSMGTPMLMAGDEWGRTQRGHDNAYDQDNELSWLDWEAADVGLRDFAKAVIALRSELPWLRNGHWPNGRFQVDWVRPDGQQLSDDDWRSGTTHFALRSWTESGRALLIVNAGPEAIDYVLDPAHGPWRLRLTTAGDEAVALTGDQVHVPAYSVVVVAAGTVEAAA